MTSGPLGFGSPGGFTADDFFRLLRSPGLPQSFGLGGPQAAAPQPQNLPPGAKGPPVRGLSRPPMAVPAQAPTASAPAPFGFGPLPSVSPQDVAQLGRPDGADASGAGGAGAIGGTGGAVDVPLPPARPPALSFGPLSSPAPSPEPATTGSVPSDGAGISNPPLPPVRPPSFGFGPLPPAVPDSAAPGSAPQGSDPRADMPASGAVPLAGSMAPNAATPPAAEKAEPSMMDRFVSGLKQSDDLLLGIGTGLMSTHGFGNGVAAGLKNYEGMSRNRAATDLARAELGLKTQKAVREQRGENATKAWLLGKGMDANLADAAMANPTVLSSVMTQLTKDPSRVTIGGNIYELRAGERPSEANLIGSAEAGPDQLRARAQATAEGTAAGKPDDTYTNIPEPERQLLGLPPGSYQRDSKGKISSINPSGTTINMGAEKAQDATVGKGYGEYQLDLANKGRNAGSTLNTLALMEQAMKAPDFYSGVGGEGVKRANQILGALGVKDSKAASAAEVFDALSNKVVLDGLGGSLGPGISNTDRDYIARTAPTLAQSEEGNRSLIGVARALAQRQQAVSQLAREYAAKNGGRLDAGFDDHLDRFASQNPLFPQARAGATASSPQEPPQGAPSGTRMAPDGHYYAPDPNRPGRYLKVQ